MGTVAVEYELTCYLILLSTMSYNMFITNMSNHTFYRARKLEEQYKILRAEQKS